MDVSVAAPDPWDAQPARRPGLLTEVGLDPIDLLLVPLERQVAEKLHAYTRRYRSGGTTRARDVVDLLLIREHLPPEPEPLRNAIQRVFARRGTHDIPERLPLPSRELAVGYSREAKEVGVVSGPEEAHRLLAEWLDPILARI